MKSRTLIMLAVLPLTMGCGVSIYDTGGCNGDIDVVIVPEPHVNTWLSVPREIERVIAPRVEGYFSPRLSRYDDYLYPRDLPYDPYDLPCCVRSDFNGDGYNDYAFLFSAEEWDCDDWYLTTKLVVVLSTPYGWEIGADVVLGTVTADICVPIEEYWSIFCVAAGFHTVTSMNHGVLVTKTVTLVNDGFYLASLDPEEEALFYASGTSVYETSWPEAGLAKAQALAKAPAGQKRVIPFKKDASNRERPVK